MNIWPSEAPVRLEVWREGLRRVIFHEYFIPICLLLGVLLRLLWVWQVNAPQVSDFKWYFERALTLAKGGGYAVNGIPTAYWPVGYPAFLSVIFLLCGPSVVAAQLVNIALYAGIILLTYGLSRQLFRFEPGQSEFGARISVLLLSFYPNHIVYAALLSTEIWFAFLLTLGSYLFVVGRGRAQWLLGAGLCWGGATLTKPQAILVPLIFLLVFFVDLPSLLKSATAVFGMLALVIVPWMGRNYRVLGTAQLSTNGGIVLFQGNNPYATGKHVWNENMKSLLGDMGTDQMVDGHEVEREARARKIATNYILQNPWRTISLWPRKFAGLYYSDVDGFYYTLAMMPVPWEKISALYWAVRVVAELYYGMILGLFVVAMPAVWRAKGRYHRIGLALMGFFTLNCLVFFGNARYHFPIMPWIVMYAGIGAAKLLRIGQTPHLVVEHRFGLAELAPMASA